MRMGLIQVYCGQGKGKTTAAIGQGIRAVGSGFKVIMIQFLKGGKTGEMDTLSRLEPDFKLFRFEKKRDFYPLLSEEEKEEVVMEIRNALNFVEKVFETKECDLLILDEILGVVKNNIISDTELLEMLLNKPDEMELVITGRILPDSIKHKVDYISNIQQVKHPYEKGIGARKGIEF